MSVSLNEVDAIAKRATRGGGYSWGLAEEAGKATRWLCSQGLDGLAALSQVMGMQLAASPKQHIPQGFEGVWQGQGVLCPLATGAFLLDSAHRLQGAQVEMRGVATPTLLLGYVASASFQLHKNLTVTCDGLTAVTDGMQLSMTGTIPDQAKHVRITTGGSLTDTNPMLTRATPDPDVWASLRGYAHRTYAPATAESRLLGAGAGLSDND